MASTHPSAASEHPDRIPGQQEAELLLDRLRAGEPVRADELEVLVSHPEELPPIEGWRCPSCNGTAYIQTGMLHDCCHKVTPVAVCDNDECGDEEPFYGLTPHDLWCDEKVLIDISRARFQGIFEDRDYVLLPRSAEMVLQQLFGEVSESLLAADLGEGRLYEQLVELAAMSAQIAGTARSGQLAASVQT